MQKIAILGVSHYKRENKDFEKVRKDGLPGYNLVHFHHPVKITLDGEEQVTKDNACVFWRPYSYQEYRANDIPFVNDYLTFNVNDPDFEDRFSIPFNQVFYINDGDEISRMFEWITWAITNTYEYQEISLEEAVLRLLEKLSKMHIDSRPDLRRNFETKRRFIELRDKMRQDPTDWTIEKMAKEVWLTRSRFSVLYKSFFGVSPNADLIMIRINYGKHLLENSNETILRISEMCGYASVEYFIRIFSKEVGVSPLQYRKEHLKKEQRSGEMPESIDLFKTVMKE